MRTCERKEFFHRQRPTAAAPAAVDILGTDHEVLAKIPGGMQMVVVSPEPGKFVPVVCLWPTEFSKDYIAGVQHYGAYAMVGQSFGIPVYDQPKNKKVKKL